MAYQGILVLLFCAAFGSIDGQLNNELQIYNRIFTGYSTETRPLINSSQSVRVKIKFILSKINKIDEVNQQMQMFGYIIAEWKDEYLVWNATDYGNIYQIVVPAKRIWLPDFVIINSADGFSRDEYVRDVRVRITSAGDVTWGFGGNMAVSCNMDLTYYPFDNQICNMEVENWQYSSSEVLLVNSTTGVSSGEYQENGMWTVTSTTSKASVEIYSSEPGSDFAIIKFEIFLVRKPGYFVVNILMPCLLLSLLALLVFWLPPDSGEKIGLGITIILAFGVYALIISQSTPQTSDSYPLLSVWMCILVIVSSFNTIMTIIVLYCHHHLPTQPPTILRSVFIKSLGRVLCVGGMPEETDKDKVQAVTPADLIITHDDGVHKQPIGNSKSEGGKSEQSELLERVTQVLRELAIISQSVKDGQVDAAAQEEWMAIARVIDRLCFWINFCVITIATVVCYSLRDNTLTVDSV